MREFLSLQLLAILQGLTEFLPVSSSGHLALLRKLLDLDTGAKGPALEILLHGGTLAAVLIFYRRRILELAVGLVKRDRDAWKYCSLVVLACIPAGLLYLAAHDAVESAFDSTLAIGACLVATGLVLTSLKLVDSTAGSRPSWLQALGIGIAQALAILPGVSRSGSTYTAARWLKVSPKEAFDFSFITSIPLILGSIILKARDLTHIASEGRAFPLLVATILATAVGYAALKLLEKLRFLKMMWIFGPYCLVAGAAAILLATRL